MIISPYIPFTALFFFVFLSLFDQKNKDAAFIMTISCGISALMIPYQMNTNASENLTGEFSIFILMVTVSFVFYYHYNLNKENIFLKLSTANAVLSGIHLFYIMTYIKSIREIFWYYAPTFDLFYWYYGELQIILTLYIISLFWKSGIMGLSNGFNATRRYFINVHNLHGGLADNSNSHCEEVAQENKVYKKGI